jgi:hypothetical protein
MFDDHVKALISFIHAIEIVHERHLLRFHQNSCRDL